MHESIRHDADVIGSMLRDAETQLDGLYDTLSRLAVANGEFARKHGMPARVGHPVREAVGRALAAVSEAQGHTVSAHRGCERIVTMMDPGYGDGQPKPRWYGTAPAPALEVVRTAA